MRGQEFWSARRMVAVWATALGVLANGCDRSSIPVTWEASGVQVTRLEMPLDDYGNTFIVGEYALEGREGSGDLARPFRDRVLLTIHAQGIESNVLGYIARSYDGGQVRTFRLYGTERRVVRDTTTMVVIGRAHALRPAGTGRYPFMAWIELRLDAANGRILAKGSFHVPDAADKGRADSHVDSALAESTSVK
ncbi:MAG: hypothetical protein ACREJK_01570 [Candidatus Methylomirabilales bacterium]